MIAERGDLSLRLRDQPLPPIDGALHIFDLALGRAPFVRLRPDRLLSRSDFVAQGRQLPREIVDVLQRGGLLMQRGLQTWRAAASMRAGSSRHSRSRARNSPDPAARPSVIKPLVCSTSPLRVAMR